MHMADALISPAVAGIMYVCSTVAAGKSVKEVRLENNSKKIPLMGIMGAFVFATQMINFTIPGTGSSGHLCGGMMLSALLGPYAGFLTMISVLLIQGLLFADGGLLALGANVWNMAFYGCFIGALLIWRPMMKNGVSKLKITLASIIGCIITLQLGAFSVTLETMASGISKLPFSTFVMTMQPIHLAIGLVEGLITSAVLCFVHEARPELLWGSQSNEEKTSNNKGLSLKTTLITLSVATLFIGGILSLYASSNPDGLEWSIEKITGSTEVEQSDTSKLHNSAADVQNTTSLLPDYSFKDSDSSIGTSFSGIIGSVLVVCLCVGSCYAFKFFKRKKKNEQNC
ncbi:energy-coupling factor ABC transporter permease [Hathewaya proteolytica]|nr:energy-coupling factor ABC transporter permease [Hathewaya proteolytica]